MRILKIILQYLLCLFFVAAGILHFVRPGFYLKMMPPPLPWPLELVYVSGFCEIVLGFLLIIPRFTKRAAWGLILLLIAVYPANIFLAMHPEVMPDVPPVMQLIRLPFQLLFIAWAWWFTRPVSHQKIK